MEKHEAFLCPFCGAPYRELIPAGTVQVKCRYCGATVLVSPRLGGLLQLCPNHPESLSLGICNDCGKSFCADCLFITDVPKSGQKTGGYFYVCSDCTKKRKEESKAGLFVAFFLLLFIVIPTFFVSVAGGLLSTLVLYPFMFAAYYYSLKKYERLPTVRMVMTKISELNKRAEKVKAAMSPQEVEDLYRRMLIPDPYTSHLQDSKIDRLLEKYMQSGLSRKEAVLKMASEEGLEIKPGLHVPPTMGDALSELKKEMKKAEPAK